MAEKMSMREAMPITAAWIDQMREVFGVKAVDNAIRRGMRGGAGFHATENGHEVGTPMRRGVRIGLDERGNMVNLDDPHAPPEPYVRRQGRPAWESTSDEQEAQGQVGLNNNKG